MPAAVTLFALGCATVPRADSLPSDPPATAPAPAAVEEIALHPDSAAVIRGWFLPGREGAGAVLLLHGAGSTHRSMLGRAGFLRREGYAVLMIDFRGHGLSSGGPVTFGAAESRDAGAALAFLRRRLPDERVAVIGASMGGAASLLGAGPLRADAFILESVYATIDEAVFGRAHAWLGPVGTGIGALFLHHWLPLTGVSRTELRPVERVARVAAPVYVMSGTDDEYTGLDEARALFDRVPGPKEFWAVEGAGHEDLYGVAGAEYERRVLAFLDRYVR